MKPSAGYEPHPVPRSAHAHAHLASFFAGEGDRPFQPRTTGRELAHELCRGLSPNARRHLLGGNA